MTGKPWWSTASVTGHADQHGERGAEAIGLRARTQAVKVPTLNSPGMIPSDEYVG